MFTFQFSYFTIYILYILARQSAHVKPVSGTSEVGPTTFQQDQSANMKSNSENEGNISTIPQESDESGTIKILSISVMYLYAEFPNIDTNI